MLSCIVASSGLAHRIAFTTCKGGDPEQTQWRRVRPASSRCSGEASSGCDSHRKATSSNAHSCARRNNNGICSCELSRPSSFGGSISVTSTLGSVNPKEFLREDEFRCLMPNFFNRVSRNANSMIENEGLLRLARIHSSK